MLSYLSDYILKCEENNTKKEMLKVYHDIVKQSLQVGAQSGILEGCVLELISTH